MNNMSAEPFRDFMDDKLTPYLRALDVKSIKVDRQISDFEDNLANRAELDLDEQRQMSLDRIKSGEVENHKPMVETFTVTFTFMDGSQSTRTFKEMIFHVTDPEPSDDEKDTE